MNRAACSFSNHCRHPLHFLCFISPSGNGLKVFIEVNTGAERHDTAYQQVMQYYENATGLKADVKCKDITRLLLCGYDPQLYKNIYNEKFPVCRCTGSEKRNTVCNCK
ncbi:MAG: hypothetical protein IPH18_14770 [Chitinophagaceae bacterium]|nr:hypothetical protein [Chitinophagaceae bacterium]